MNTARAILEKGRLANPAEERLWLEAVQVSDIFLSVQLFASEDNGVAGGDEGGKPKGSHTIAF